MRSVAIFLLLGSPVFACECASLSICERLEAPVIFIGQVIDGGVSSVREDPWYSNSDHVRFQVVEIFRGLPKGTRFVEMEVLPPAGMCSANPYFRGRTYLVMPGRRNGKLFDGVCFSGRDVERVQDDVRYVRDYFAGKSTLNIHGRVAAARDYGGSGMLDFLFSVGEAKPLPGARVSTAKDGKIFSTVTDADGKYVLPVPTQGDYDLKAELRPYSPVELSAEIESGGCAVSDFSLASGATISGFVRDGEGRVLTNLARVGLIDLDRASLDPGVSPFLQRAYTEQRDHSFLFRDVPIGRYLLKFNPDGPQSGQIGDQLFESTFFPRHASRLQAKTIEVTRAGAHLTDMDIEIGKPVNLRSVVVHVGFPDGAPMNWAEVRVTSESAEAGTEPWTCIRSTGLEKGVARFEAPSGLNLRIEVRDAHGRNLKTTYVSTHPAGPDRIDEHFVVRP